MIPLCLRVHYHILVVITSHPVRIQNRRRSIYRNHMVPLRLHRNAAMLHHNSFVVKIIHYCTMEVFLIRNQMKCETQVNGAHSSIIDKGTINVGQVEKTQR
jgi:hypothetical protein